MEKSLGFNNPNNTNHLAGLMGLEPKVYSFMKGLRGRFPEQEYAQELRQVQASKWAFRSVAEGIEHFKSGRHSEAFQCLNKALNIDPRNVEGLVARGALYANSGSFQKAIEDFESAHKLNPNHQNARKYMGETLVALGRSHEDEGRLDEALKAYESCLAVVPFHEEAQNSIEYLRTKMASVGKGDVSGEGANGQTSSEALIPGLTPSKTQEMKETLKQLLKEGEEDEEEVIASIQQKKKDKERSKNKKKKNRKSRKHHRRRSTSSSSSSSNSSSRSSSSSSSSSTVESSSGSSHSHSQSRSRSRSTSRTRKSSKRRSKGSRSKKGKEERKEKSLSPLSKRMAMMEPNHSVLEGSAGFAADVPPKGSDKDNEYEQRVRRFLEQTKGDSEYEDKVRKFLDETARWKKERKGQEKDSKKKKKKDKSRSRDKEKSKKKKKDRDEKDYDKKKRHRKRGDKYAGDLDKAEHLKEALRRELSEQVGEVGLSRKNRQRSSMDDDDEFLYSGASTQERNEENPAADLRILGLEEIPDLDDLESKLSAYYAKVEKDTGISKRKQWHEVPSNVESRFAPRRKVEEKGSGEEKKRRYSQSPSAKGSRNMSSSPKLMYGHHEEAKEDDLSLRDKKKYDMFAESPTPPKLSATDSVPVMKWKMQVGPGVSRFKKKERSERDKEPWEDLEEKHYIFAKEEAGSEEEHKKSPETEEKFVPHRSAPRESVDKEAPMPVGMQPPVPGEEDLTEPLNDGVGKTLQFYEKFRGGYRIGKKASEEPSSGPSAVIGNNSLSTAANSASAPPPREESSQRQVTPVVAPSGGPSTPGKRPSITPGAKGPKTDSEDSDSSTSRRQGGAESGTRRRSRSASSGGESSPHSRRSRSRSRARGGRYSRSAASSDSDSSRSYERRRRRRSRSKSSRRSSYGRHSRSGSYTGGGRGGGGEGGGGGGGRYGSRSRSRSYDDRYRSSVSRSRSRSRSYDRSRSRSYDRRSRSGSPHRRPHDHRSQHGSKYPPGRFPRHRGGTYYRPRYQGYKNPRGGFVPRGRGYHPKFSQRGGGRPFIPRGRGRGRGRFFHYKPGYRSDKDGYHRRYEQRGRSRDRDSEDRRSSYSRGEDDPMKKVDEAKEKINRYIAETGGDEVESKRREESLSEGEEVDEERFGRAEGEYVDRKVFEGKWADGDEEKGRSRGNAAEEGGKSATSGGGDLPSIEEMDKFLNKVKAQKKEEMKERNKAFVKPTAW
ncbi:hypothetical protein J437_LFUL014263 [Ladona fulva]|uniref:Tetratricopeptide repeat protein 14 n=1 Tax=Ladona fulva TaxID=123851 RepID=A0A8K0P7U7_LADFU|nr:hypothetical protein J437_LFUL014263 [Ladona fulva]